MDRKRVMITLGGGGHLWQSRSLIRQLAPDYDLVFVTGDQTIVPKGAPFSTSRVYRLPEVASIARHGNAHRLIRVLAGVRAARHVIREARPRMIIGVATALSLPLLLAARTLGIPAVFIESITRTDGLSQTGRLVHRLGLAKAVYVQWPDAADPQRGILYAGTVL